jgi:transposase
MSVMKSAHCQLVTKERKMSSRACFCEGVIFLFLICCICSVVLLVVLVKKHRVQHDYGRKMRAIMMRKKHPNMSLNDLAKEFKVTKSTMQGWLASETEINFRTMGKNKRRKRARSGVNPILDIALLEYFNSYRQHHRNETISDADLNAWSIAIAEVIGCRPFTASGLKRLKYRHGIKYKRERGSAADADAEAAENWIKNELPKIREKYPGSRIYNVDQSCIFWRALPNRTLAYKSDLVAGSGSSKKRVTFQLCASVDGKKRRMLIVGNSAKPRCFPGGKPKFDADYTSNETAWVNCHVVEVWMQGLNQSFARRGVHIALILDNLSAYKKAKLDLTHITLHYLPPGCTSLIQGLDQGIIWNLKVLYRNSVLKDRLDKMKKNIPWKFNFYDACVKLSKAWKDLSKDTIVNCFNHAFSFDKSKLFHPVFQHLHPPSTSSSSDDNTAAPSPPSLSTSLVSHTSTKSRINRGLPNLENTCYLNSFLQAIASCTTAADIQHQLEEDNTSELNVHVCTVLQQLQAEANVNVENLQAVVDAFRDTLDEEETYRPQDVLVAFNSFMQLLAENGGVCVADHFTRT